MTPFWQGFEKQAINPKAKKLLGAAGLGAAGLGIGSGLYGLKKHVDKKQKIKATQAFKNTVSGLEESVGYPLPKTRVNQWQSELESKPIKGKIEGHNFFANKFNEWLNTPEGEKWNEEQAKLYKGGK